MNIIIAIIKKMGTRKALEIAFQIAKWVVKQTDGTEDDKVVEKLYALFQLLYPYIPAKQMAMLRNKEPIA